MIESVELINWKAFDKLTLPFSQGINFITGPNGIGKSSILQAVCVAFTGQVPDGFDIRNFVRIGSDLCKVRVAFRNREELVYIERRLSLRQRERCSVLDSANNEIFGGTWDELTAYIESLLGIGKFLFNRIFYLSEGDVYRTLHEPPGKEMFNEIDRLLGITQMQDLLKVIDQSRAAFQIEKTKQIEILKKMGSKTETKEDLDALQAKLMELQNDRDVKRDQRDKLTTDLWSCKDKLRRTEILLEDLKYLDTEEKSLLKDQEKKASLEKQLVQMLKEHEAITRDHLECESQVSTLAKIVDILKQTGQSGIVEVECPVCRRPISLHKMNQLREEMTEKITSLGRRSQDLLKHSNSIDMRKGLLESELAKMREREIRVRTLREKPGTELGIDETRALIEETKRRIETLREKTERLDEELKSSDTEIGRLRERIGNIKAIEQFEEKEISDAMNNLEIACRGEYLSDFTLKGIEELMKVQRDSKLRENLYSYISEVWNNFKGERGWTVELDQFALPVARIRHQEYPFNLLSGGEKTALLVVARTILSSLFAKEVGFLVLDEPLEHLDSRNRHSLLQFLVDAYNEKMVSQLIITTTEHALLRRFADYEYVKIHPLYRR